MRVTLAVNEADAPDGMQYYTGERERETTRSRNQEDRIRTNYHLMKPAAPLGAAVLWALAGRSALSGSDPGAIVRTP